MELLFQKTTVIELAIIVVLYFIFLFYPFAILFTILLVKAKIKDSKRKECPDLKGKKMTGAVYNVSGNLFRFDPNCRIPHIAEEEILVKVYSASLNPVDFKFVCCKVPFFRWFHDHEGIGSDFTGKVVMIGANVTQFKEGDEVFGFSRDGGLQEYTRCLEKDIAKKPNNVSFNQAAALTLAGCTSYQALTWFFPIQGKTVLIIGASGGTGHYAVQLAKYLKAAQVYGVCSSSKSDFVRYLGADKVIEYDKKDYLNDFGDVKFDLIYDTVTSANDANQETLYRQYLKEGGKYVAINSGSKLEFFIGMICSVFNISAFERKDYHLHLLRWNQQDTALMGKIASEGKLTATIEVMTFEKKSIETAFEALKKRRTKGKIVFEIFT